MSKYVAVYFDLGCGLREKTGRGTGKAEWSTSTIDRMPSNEKYAGGVLTQKTCTPDFLTGKKREGTRMALALHLFNSDLLPGTVQRVQ